MSNDGDKGLETLQIWQKGLTLAAEICQQVLPLLPSEEKWSLVSQLRRSAQSVPANIAEGYGRYYYQDSIRFCYIARGSLEETFSHLVLANKLGYLKPDVLAHLSDEIQELRRMLNGYIAFLKQSKRGAGEPGANLLIRDESELYTIEDDTSTNS